jgi:pimeloyl-ACP methyl ester carboxylesterase
MPKALVNGIKIHYQRPGRGPDLVFLHGLAANLGFWYFRIVPLLTGDYRVTAYDLRGHGLSDMPRSRYTSADMAHDLRCLLDALGIERAHLVGHSFGGVVALQFAALYPERVASLMIADSQVGALQPVPRLREWPFWRSWKGELERHGISLGDDQELDFRLLERLAARPWRRDGPGAGAASMLVPFGAWNGSRRGALRWLELLRNTTARDDFRDEAGLTLARIREVGHPTRAVYGEYSFCRPTCARLLEVLPRCDAVIVPRAGHFHPAARPGFFLRTLRDFLTDRAREGA